MILIDASRKAGPVEGSILNEADQIAHGLFILRTTALPPHNVGMIAHKLPYYPHGPNDYAPFKNWREWADHSLRHTLTRVDPRTGDVVTTITPPRAIFRWLMENMTSPFTFDGDGGMADAKLYFESEEDAALYKLRWL